MQTVQASRTAMIAAVLRGQHRERHPGPWVFDDPLALALVGPRAADIWAQLCELFPTALCDQAIACVCGRSRFAEDRLAAGCFDQYVVLGAGLDSFAWRCADVLAAVRVFEVDHPASQAAKRERAHELGLPRCERHVFAPCDFETETLAGCLDAVGFDWTRPTLFSWLGVTMYLTIEAIQATCRLVAECPPGSQITISYAVAAGHVDADGERMFETFMPVAASSGEPIITRLSPAEAEALLNRCGLQVTDHPSHEELEARYFTGRTDGLRPAAIERVLAAQVPDDTARLPRPGSTTRDEEGKGHPCSTPRRRHRRHPHREQRRGGRDREQQQRSRGAGDAGSE